MNAARRFPLGDSTFDYVFSEHQIEHLTYAEGLVMLRECHRVLKPGARIRVATPDLSILTGLSAREKSETQLRYMQWIVDKFLPDVGVYRASFVINNAFQNWWHKFIYDCETLQAAMEEVGFVDVTAFPVGHSEDEALRAIESHGMAAGNEDMNRFETMVLEAMRPREEGDGSL